VVITSFLFPKPVLPAIITIAGVAEQILANSLPTIGGALLCGTHPLCVYVALVRRQQDAEALHAIMIMIIYYPIMHLILKRLYVSTVAFSVCMFFNYYIAIDYVLASLSQL
jgi:hypothetical protein